MLFAQLMGDGVLHGLVESLPVAALAVAASERWMSRSAHHGGAMGLLTSSRHPRAPLGGCMADGIAATPSSRPATVDPDALVGQALALLLAARAGGG